MLFNFELAEDILLFLRSKYGISIEQNKALRILRGLGGSSSDSESNKKSYRKKRLKNRKEQENSYDIESPGIDQNELNNEANEEIEYYLDLVQIVAIMLIPTILKAEKDYRLFDDDEDNSMDSDEIEYLKQNPNHDTVINDEAQAHYPPNLIQDVLQILISSANKHTETNNTNFKKSMLLIPMKSKEQQEYPEIDEEFMHDLLLSFDEVEAASNKKLIHKMIDVARGGRQGRVVLDESTLLRVLTHDVINCWKVGTEHNISTSFYDVFGIELRDINFMDCAGKSEFNPTALAENYNERDDDSMDELDAQEQRKKRHKVKFPRLKNQARSIDYVMDTYASLSFVVLIFLFCKYRITDDSS